MELQRKLTTKHVWAIAVGMVISGQYFGWNFGFQVAGVQGMFIAAGIVTLFYFCFMLSYAELATMIPKAGGPSAYAERALGRTGGFIAGISCLIEFVFAPPAIAVATGAYVHFLWPIIPSYIAAVTAFAGCLLINLSSTKDVARFEMIITVLALCGLIIFYAANLNPAIGWHHSITPTSSSLTHHWPAAIPFAIWLYLAIEGAVMTAEEVIKPERDLARGIILAIITLGICSALTLWFTATHCHDPRAAIDYPLTHTLTEYYGVHSWVVNSVGILGLFGLLASLNGIMIGYARQTYALSRARYLPAFLSRLTKNGSPIWALILPGMFGIICTASANLSNSLIILAAFGAVCMYCISLLSLFVLRIREPHAARPYKVFYPWLPGMGLLLGLLCVGCVFKYAIMPGEITLFKEPIHLISVLVIIVVGGALLQVMRRPTVSDL